MTPPTPKTNYLYLRIIAEVSRAPRGLTVAAIAEATDCTPQVIAHCIALHSFLRDHDDPLLTVPPPPEYRLPGLDEVVTRQSLEASDTELAAIDAEMAELLFKLHRGDKGSSWPR